MPCPMCGSRGGPGKTYKIPGLVKLLFETPSGFALFSFDEKYLEKGIEILRLHEFRKFEYKPNVINLTAQTIDVGLTQMLWKYCDFDETLVVGSIAYKDLIGKLLGLNCHYEDAVKEVMWGLRNLMHTLVPQEQSVVTKDDLFPMSLGLHMVLTRHNVNVEKEMLNGSIIKKTAKVYETDLREKIHSRFLHKTLDEKFKELSGVDTKEWPLFKLATASKMMFDPHGRLKVGYPHKIFSRNELMIITRDAPLYQHTVNKERILKVYGDVITLLEDKAGFLYELRILVKEAKAALETEEVQEEPSANGVDSKKQVGCTCLTEDLTVPNQSSIDEGQHCHIKGENSCSILGKLFEFLLSQLYCMIY
ncbi:hypothetical protein ACQ4PT_001399 [Festuca glaucescens]